LLHRIENLENLPKLNVLSLGRNRIKDLESIKACVHSGVGNFVT